MIRGNAQHGTRAVLRIPRTFSAICHPANSHRDLAQLEPFLAATLTRSAACVVEVQRQLLAKFQLWWRAPACSAPPSKGVLQSVTGCSYRYSPPGNDDPKHVAVLPLSRATSSPLRHARCAASLGVPAGTATCRARIINVIYLSETHISDTSAHCTLCE